MQDFLKNLAALIKVKTIVTLVVVEFLQFLRCGAACSRTQ